MGRGEDLILAVDCGTQFVKAAVFDTHGALQALARRAHAPDTTPYARWVEHDPLDYWANTRAVIREALAAIGEGRARLKAVGLTSQRGTTIPVDADGSPLRPAIVYLDNRVNENLPPVKGIWGLFFKAIGRSSAIDYVRAHSRFLWIKQHEPQVYTCTFKFMQVASYLNFQLTGQFNESLAMMVGMFPLDVKNLRFYPQQGIHDIFGVAPRQLPELKPPLSIVGHITRAAAQQTTIPEGLPVVVGGGDVQSAVIGMGAVAEECASLVLGTTVDFQLSTKHYAVDKHNRFMPWAAAVPGEYILETGVGSGFMTVSWFTRELAHYETQRGRENGKTPEQLLDEAIQDIPPGSLGLIVHPYWAPPIQHDEARGSILGLTVAHTRAHIYRAILEGLAYETRAGFEAIQAKTGTRLREIRVSGGGSQSDMVLAIIADVFQTPAVRMQAGESTTLGAAICAACGIGLFVDLNAGIQSMVHPERRFEPDPEHAGVYNTLYQTYKEIYPRIAEFYRRTEEIASPGRKVKAQTPHPL